jgi:EAL domain-containing protein (putative c-di-GMP-specific phosphodiesterase class I)
VEALLRLDHPTYGLLGPPHFLNVAESSGMIVPIGAWVIEEVCRQQVVWRHEHPLQVAVNLSGRQLNQIDLCAHVQGAMDRSGIIPSDLVIELTESVFVRASLPILAGLEDLKAMGVHFALDDFGTGFSSFSRLQRFPVDSIKIGSEFVTGVGMSARATDLVAAIVNLSHALHMGVVAEGVELAEQLILLRGMNCDSIQGFYFARPTPAEQIPAVLADIVRMQADGIVKVTTGHRWFSSS